MKHKVSELEGALLDAAVAKAEEFPSFWIDQGDEGRAASCVLGPSRAKDARFDWCPASAWEQGGPIIERERIDISSPDPFHDDFEGWYAYLWTGRSAMTVSAKFNQRGPTPLIAAMRAYVASKFGEEVDL